jgi:hypothetical protein
LICDGNGVRLLKVHPRCQNLTEELSAYIYDDKGQVPGGDRKPFKISDHGPDAVRYLAWRLRFGV